MKATELMVGDYIMFDGSPYIIEEISAKGWIHILDIKNKARVALSSDYILDFIEGIPLTPERLEKIGFVKSDVFIEWKYEGNDVKLYMLWKTFPYIEIRSEDSYLSFSCEYVHELQHALKLCNISREIIL